ncbi:hypothetical protein GCM10011609_02700 [Lentzea pudingi]|uniref:Excreted virulence factor EspC, type VII ESX diderm n=1 Tax=Lentzea pudingi TaxID=1789439 RepID=A0ABQ2H994_9PSEU|nr:hypothetical protein [Lentzea pudingi]GGM70468.1 hypothetical protein GCM10011609_02700 [Lentzea pudingi]
MTGTGFTFDPAAISELVSTIASLRDDLEARTGGHHDLPADVSGDHRVSAAVDEFSSNWRDVRARVIENLDRCLDALRDTATTYELVENEVRQSVGGAQ